MEKKNIFTKPDIYNASNEILRKVAFQSLVENADKLKFNKQGDTAIDVGCGDGSVSTMVKNFTPFFYKKFVGCDIGEKMVQFANEHYGGPNVSFIKLDIEDDLPTDLIGSFNRVFSFFTLQLVKKQEEAFKNIYNLLTDEGEIFAVFLVTMPVYKVFKILADSPKWKTWLKDLDVFVSPYHDMKNPEKKVAKILEKCNFKNVDVKFKEVTFVHDDVQTTKNFIRGIWPFYIPQDEFDELVDEYVKLGQEIGVIHINNDGKSTSVILDSSILVVHANK